MQNTLLQGGGVMMFGDSLLTVQGSTINAGALVMHGGSCNVSNNTISSVSTLGNCVP